MPTGYTSKLHDGEQSFEAYVWGCARAFGAAVLMRDEPSNVPITEDRITESYYEPKLCRDQAAMVEWASTTQEARRALYDSWVATTLANNKKHEDERVARRARYQATLNKARAWVPPSAEHVKFREFLIEQLTTSIDFDCSVYTTEVIGFVEWCDARGTELKRSIAYTEAEVVKERERNESRIRWVRDLKDSIPMPEKS